MRRAFRQTLNRLLRTSGPGLSGLALQALSAHVRPGLAPPFGGPILATLEITRRCNLNCPFCETHGGSDAEDASWMGDFIREAADLGARGLGLTGGEPLLASHLTDRVREGVAAGLLVHLNTNGTLLDRSRAEALIDAGVSSVNLSMDGATEATHDRVRGPGNLTRALRGLEALVRARDQSGATLRILLTCVAGEANAHELIDLPRRARDLGADGATFLPRAAFLETRPAPSPAAARAARELSRRAGRDGVDNSRRYLSGMVRYLEGEIMPGRCSAPRTSVLATPSGRLYPCVPAAMRGRGGVPFSPGRLRELYRAGLERNTLDETLCAHCWWNCHRELDLALGVL